MRLRWLALDPYCEQKSLSLFLPHSLTKIGWQDDDLLLGCGYSYGKKYIENKKLYKIKKIIIISMNKKTHLSIKKFYD